MANKYGQSINFYRSIACGLMLGCLISGPAHGTWFDGQLPQAGKPSNQVPKEIRDVGVTPKIGDDVPQDVTFVSSAGEVIRLGELFQSDLPLILTLNYASCPMLCHLQLDALVKALQDSDLQLGRDYRMVTVSIDPDEDLQRLAAFQQKYLGQLNQAEAKAGDWLFLKGDSSAIGRVAEGVGFHYTYLPDQKEYAHSAVLMVLSPSGRITRYLYGVAFGGRDVRFALLEAAQGKLGSALEQILLTCFHYDATRGVYAPHAVRLMQLGGGITLILMAFVGWLLWRSNKAKVVAEESMAAQRSGA